MSITQIEIFVLSKELDKELRSITLDSLMADFLMLKMLSMMTSAKETNVATTYIVMVAEETQISTSADMKLMFLSELQGVFLTRN